MSINVKKAQRKVARLQVLLSKLSDVDLALFYRLIVEECNNRHISIDTLLNR